MQINVIVPDNVKRAVRYLELTPETVEGMLIKACEDRLNILVRNAKKVHAETQTMEIIDPEPVS